MNHFSVCHTFNHVCAFLWEKNQGILEIDVTTTLILTEFQIYRITEWLELEGTTVGSSGPTLFLRQLHPNLAARDCPRQVSNITREGDIAVLCHLQVEVKVDNIHCSSLIFLAICAIQGCQFGQACFPLD